MAVKGWVYVITNKAMPGLVKVGFSLKDPSIRAAQFDQAGLPHPYEVAFEALVPNPREMEQKAHVLLHSRREMKEWFRCSPTEAIEAIRRVTNGQVILETARTQLSPNSDDELLLAIDTLKANGYEVVRSASGWRLSNRSRESILLFSDQDLINFAPSRRRK